MLRRYGSNRLTLKQVLTKKQSTLPQTQLPRAKRLVNLTGAFAVKANSSVQDKTVLLVDDIFTTGSTINECARTLKQAGARRVDFFVLARSQTS